MLPDETDVCVCAHKGMCPWLIQQGEGGGLTVLLLQVELLHGLVYQTLEYISERNRK